MVIDSDGNSHVVKVKMQVSQVSVSTPDNTVSLGKAHMHSAPETFPTLALLSTNRPLPQQTERWLLPFSTPLSFRPSVL